MMIELSDGRVLRVRRNGMSHVAIDDNTAQSFTFDIANAERLADALIQSNGSCRVSTSHGRVLELRGFRLWDATVADRRGPWPLDEHQKLALAKELLRVVA
jgi:hypothetical protein